MPPKKSQKKAKEEDHAKDGLDKKEEEIENL
jgi:hypothetical protein